jgi:hypothetical protein
MTPQLIERGIGESKLEVMAEPTLRWPRATAEPPWQRWLLAQQSERALINLKRVLEDRSVYGTV